MTPSYPNPLDFGNLLHRRWDEACASLGMNAHEIQITWDIGPYPHFQKKRGYAVAVAHANGTYHLRFAEKTLRVPVHRADGLIRHEIGHVVDFLFSEPELDAWAFKQGVTLPSTPERRADAIAAAIWGEPIRYDDDLVQSTRIGIAPRPEHLGL
jgi:hypothetical protein